ncbi:MAG: hypothetical protein NTZ93_04690 [Candidatus Beckwithbacteria bacterium]|nr:hypothetical protein [Candidatus Beckwithbacteria bacterium]
MVNSERLLPDPPVPQEATPAETHSRLEYLSPEVRERLQKLAETRGEAAAAAETVGLMDA